MKKRITVLLFLMAGYAGFGDGYSDETIKQMFVEYLRPRTVDKDLEPHRRKELIDVIHLRSDTNRLARLLVELAQTNNAWYANMAMWQLEKYATPEHLPFLHSCATNPVIGHMAMKAVLNVEGITSNSLESLGRYFALTNTIDNADHARAELCARIIHLSKENRLCNSSISNIVNTYMLSKNCNSYWFDTICIKNDATYEFSKRRLAFLRGAVTNAVQWKFQINYVTNAINELVAYPESDLPE